MSRVRDALFPHVTEFTKNRKRGPGDDVAAKFMAAALNQPQGKAVLGQDRVSADGTPVLPMAVEETIMPQQTPPLRLPVEPEFSYIGRDKGGWFVQMGNDF